MSGRGSRLILATAEEMAGVLSKIFSADRTGRQRR